MLTRYVTTLKILWRSVQYIMRRVVSNGIVKKMKESHMSSSACDDGRANYIAFDVLLFQLISCKWQDLLCETIITGPFTYTVLAKSFLTHPKMYGLWN